jgi:carboxyl-terminal processing protease
MLTPELGYIKIKNFGETTYAELLTALAQLEEDGFKGLVVDLRGNGGGYLTSSIQMVNEFLPQDCLIVYTEGRKSKREEYKSDGRGSYQQLPIIVLTDELTASAAEIFSGAIQDNDRGIIVGRRSFGKGLVQQPVEFSDGSMIRLTVARYYTPSGRCIQKPYVKGQKREEYEMDIITRYQHGEFFNEDSIRQTGEVYHTSIGREVYGGGGIMPDYFVAEDTTLFTSYYTEAVSSGLISQFCFEYVDNNRAELQKSETPDDLLRHIKRQGLVDQFVRYADNHDLRRRNNMILKSKKLFEQAIYGNIIYSIFDIGDYTAFVNRSDATILRAVDLFKKKKTTPTLPRKD